MPLYTTLKRLLNVLVQIANKAGFYKNKCLLLDLWSGVRLGALDTSATNLPLVPAPDGG
jgi:hypothetical protein